VAAAAAKIATTVGYNKSKHSATIGKAKPHEGKLVKGSWTMEVKTIHYFGQRVLMMFLFGMFVQEDHKLLELVQTHGAKKWSFIASHLPGRIHKQCRERYHLFNSECIYPTGSIGPKCSCKTKSICVLFI
jgi:hypothetical protein